MRIIIGFNNYNKRADEVSKNMIRILQITAFACTFLNNPGKFLE